MTVILRTIMAGPHGNFKPGDKASFSAEVEQQLIAGGYATEIEAAIVEPPEAAVIEPPEVAIVEPPEQRGGRGGKRR